MPGKLRCRFTDIQLAGDHIGDEAGAVFVEQVDLALCQCNVSLYNFRLLTNIVNYYPLLFLRRTEYPNAKKFLWIKP